MNKTKLLNLTLASTLLFSSIPVSANTQYINSNESVEETQNITENNNSNCDVYAELGSIFKVTIPKKVTLDGGLKKGTYQVSVEGDIAGLEVIKVIPDEAVTLSSKDKADVISIISQDKVEWNYNEIIKPNNILGNGEIDANKITAGAWNGTFNFNISLTETNYSNITVESKNEAGENLNATATDITGAQKDSLLEELDKSGLANKEEVDAIIEVKSDEFDGMADTTFDVSSIAKEGDQIVILHYDETKQEWEFISQETVDVNGKINANFSSYSPVAFVKVNADGTYDKISLEAGLYDENNQMIYSWDELVNMNSIVVKGTVADVHDYYPLAGKLVFDDNITEIASQSFNNTKLTEIVLPSNLKKLNLQAFASCPLTSVTFPDGDIDIGTQAFRDCDQLTEIKFGKGNYKLGSMAFVSCDALKHIIIPKGVSIGEQVFYQCNNLETVIIEDGVTTIGEEAFEYCRALNTIEIPGTISSFGANIFGDCTNLQNITLHEGITEIPQSMFRYCSKIKSIGGKGSGAMLEIPNSVKVIRSYAFGHLTNMDTVIIPKGITTLESNAFYYCIKVRTVYLPKSLISSNKAFDLANNKVTNIYYEGNEEEWNQIQFTSENDLLNKATIHYNYTE